MNSLNKYGPIGLLIARKKRYEETGRVILNANNNDDNNYINLIKQFTEKPIIDLEYPEATGIYIFNNRFLDLLKLVSKENEGKSFDLSKDVLSKIDYYTKDRLYCYLLRINETNWVDIESPTYIERNKKTIDIIISQMETVKQNDSLLNKKPID